MNNQPEKVELKEPQSNKHLMDVNANSIIENYRKSVSELELKIMIKDEQLKNHQKRVAELEDKVASLEAQIKDMNKKGSK